MRILVNRLGKKCPFLFFAAIFLLSSLFSSAQIFEERGYWSESTRYNYIPIDSLWLFHPGNDKPDFVAKDSDWQPANTTLLTNEKGDSLKELGFGWYKKTFEVPEYFRGKAVALRIAHYGASEIFLDGKLIQRYGEVGGSVKDERIFVPHIPVIIFLDSQSSHSIWVHYSNMLAGTSNYGSIRRGFRVYIGPSDIVPQIETSKIQTLPISASIMFLFGIFFLFVYFFYPQRLASLITMILLLNFSALFVATYFTATESELEPLRRASEFGLLTSLWNNLLPIFVLYALYYDGKLPRRSFLVVLAMVICFFAAFYPRLAILIGPIIILGYFELFRMLVLGIMRKKSGFWILFVGTIIQQVGYFLIIQNIFHWFPDFTPGVLIIMMIFPQLGVPLTYALQFAWEFGRTNRDLRLQLAQVKTLSETTLRQEQEKQEMLMQQKENLETMVTNRTSELSIQKEALQKTLVHLESTQAQLIQSEKMASLGELTAGIAHEIQNPLNFINNFSEVNKELVEELKAEGLRPKAERNERLEEEILNNIKNNEEKISHHGQRADAIVKGMLQHSRTSSGQKEPTDINALADEYLRLAYQGLRSKDKFFNAKLVTDFDPSAGAINMVSQDMGRVFLNLYNNAFYAVNEKRKRQGEPYEPCVSIITKKTGDNLSILIKDNGVGIPQKVKDKIFQPFFTTKPTGEGTGLGLSLSYDVIKVHGGEIQVTSIEGEGTEFQILIPYN